MYSKIQPENVALIVANVHTRLNLRWVISLMVELGVHIVVFRQENYAIIRAVMIALKNHSRRIQKQNIGARQKTAMRPHEMYSKIRPQNMGLVVANVLTRLNLHRIISLEENGVHIVLINNYAIMRTTVMFALKNHSRRIQTQNIGARQTERTHEMYSKVQATNIALIVVNVLTRLNLRHILSLEWEDGAHIVVFQHKNYAQIRTVMLALKNHSRRIQKQNIGARQMERRPHEIYSKVRAENIGLIVINVITRLNLRRILSLDKDLGVHIVLINNYAIMRTTVMFALKNHSRRIQTQNIGARQTERTHEMYSKVQATNIALIVVNVLTRLNLRHILSLEWEDGAHIVVFQHKNYAQIRTVMLALKNHSRRIQKQNIGARQM